MPIYLLQHTAIEKQAKQEQAQANRKTLALLATIAMASTQCYKYKPVEQTSNQGDYYEHDSSLAHKHATHLSLIKTHTQCTTKTQAYYGQTQTNNPSPNNGYGYGYGYGYGHPPTQTPTNYVEQTEAHGSTTTVCVDQSKVHGHGQGHGHAHSSNSNGLNMKAATASGCHGNGSKKRGVPKRRGLLQKLKDRLSGGDSSSSDSESDGERSERRSPSVRYFFININLILFNTLKIL